MINFEYDEKKGLFDYCNFKIYYDNKVFNFADIGVIDKDQSIYIKFNNKCNISCVYCFQKYDYRAKSDFKLKSYNGLVEKINNLNGRFILFGGEPLIPENLNLLEELFLSTDKKYSVFTNGCFSEDVLLFINDYSNRFSEFIITLDGDKEIHDSRRILSRGSSFEKIIANIKEMSKYNHNIVIQINIDNRNYTKIDNLIQSLIINNIDNCQVSLNKVLHTDSGISEIDLLNLFIHLTDIYPKMNITVNSKVLNKIWSVISRQGKIFHRCNASKTLVFDFSAGKIYSCPQKTDYITGEFDTENHLLYESKIDEIKKYSEKNHPKCFNCKLNYLCKFGCFVDNDIQEDGRYLCQLETISEVEYIMNNFGKFFLRK